MGGCAEVPLFVAYTTRCRSRWPSKYGTIESAASRELGARTGRQETAPKEGLHDRRERAERKAHGAQRPGHNNELGEGAKTKFRRRLTSAQPM